MKKIIRFSVFFVTSLCFFIFCGDKGTNGSNSDTPNTPNTPDTPEIRASIIGDWEAEIDLSTMGKYLINLSIVSSGSSFQMNVIEMGQTKNVTIYKHSGTWQLGKNNFRGEDSLYLIGDECYMIDRSTDPARMVPLIDSIAKQTIALDTSGTGNDTWVIKLGSMTPFMKMIPSQFIPFISNIDLIFKRKEKVVFRY